MINLIHNTEKIIHYVFPKSRWVLLAEQVYQEQGDQANLIHRNSPAMSIFKKSSKGHERGRNG